MDSLSEHGPALSQLRASLTEEHTDWKDQLFERDVLQVL